MRTHSLFGNALTVSQRARVRDWSDPKNDFLTIKSYWATVKVRHEWVNVFYTDADVAYSVPERMMELSVVVLFNLFMNGVWFVPASKKDTAVLNGFYASLVTGAAAPFIRRLLQYFIVHRQRVRLSQKEEE
eukprot:PhF_6_TR29118/c0_g2_i1/m.42501